MTTPYPAGVVPPPIRKWIPQPSKKKVCGQVAVAVVTGKPLDEVIRVVGKKGCTKTKDIVKGLRTLGFHCAGKCQRMKESPPLAIAQVHSPKRSGWHWVVIDGDKIWDGHFGTSNGKVVWPECWRITSYLRIYEWNF